MPTQLRISVRFLDGTFHGRGNGGEPEWPPSPLRLFQSITNAAARLDGDGIGAQNAATLRWLEAVKQPPEILASTATPTTGYQLYVPDNVGDLVAKQWSAGKYFDAKNHPIDISGYRTEKVISPQRLSGDAAVHYIWNLDDTADFGTHNNTLIAMVRAVSRLGWGIDLVVADAVVEENTGTAARPSGERWLPVETSGGTSLRVPVAGTLDALEERHAAFLRRVRHLDDGGEIFVPVPSLAPTAFRVITYRRETELARPPYAIFALRKPDDSGFAAFDPQWRRLHLAGMLRHTASQPDFSASLGWDKEKTNAFVLGHDKSDHGNTKPTTNAPRLLFIPLPSIEWRGGKRGNTIGSIRRVLVTVTGHCDPAEFSRIECSLEGRELIDEKTGCTAAFLRRQSEKAVAIADYFKESAAWTTVTPVVLPGHDDPRKLRHRLRDGAPLLSAAEKEQIIRKLDTRIERLLRKAFLDAGLPAPLVAATDLQWRSTGFFPGADLASRYSAPDQCRRFRRLHVRVIWRERVSNGELRPIKLCGPFCIGSGRFSGLGLFVPMPAE
ncbi:MAG: type I-U CRISPR-associated protein Cas5/Cas6 [Opitutaceae bacterium]|jgi:CRISPR-associated protein Csb2|nr:type I-U CRISPR-associated protein Cas5/Cas6 [Opitutaceae bacterium]